jgi:hypothetical protein
MPFKIRRQSTSAHHPIALRLLIAAMTFQIPRFFTPTLSRIGAVTSPWFYLGIYYLLDHNTHIRHQATIASSCLLNKHHKSSLGPFVLHPPSPALFLPLFKVGSLRGAGLFFLFVCCFVMGLVVAVSSVAINSIIHVMWCWLCLSLCSRRG